MKEFGSDGGSSGRSRTSWTTTGGWIAGKGDEISALPEELRETGRSHLNDARDIADRIERGVRLLASDPEAARAFRLMNRAMDLQRTRQDLQRGAIPGEQYWRPFQIAFILLNLEGLTDPASRERELADLLWFPTGGGKTEAYLGLIGYSILLRRLRDPGDGGVSVLMRYTLRLLTIQQFDRAAGLVCALESIRRVEMPDAVGISLGLWVGQGATPNKVKDAKAAIGYLQRGEHPPNGNPVQLLRCPVCGTALSTENYRFLTGPDRMVVRCPNAVVRVPGRSARAPRRRGRLPRATVTGHRHGRQVRRDGLAGGCAQPLLPGRRATRPPDLIVQDELHLISGPLGTMVGLYETAVDAAATGEARPKVVASTATIRRASDQVRRRVRPRGQAVPSTRARIDGLVLLGRGDRRRPGARGGTWAFWRRPSATPRSW